MTATSMATGHVSAFEGALAAGADLAEFATMTGTAMRVLSRDCPAAAAAGADSGALPAFENERVALLPTAAAAEPTGS